MRNVFFGIAFALLARSAWSDCSDTTIVLKTGTPGFTNTGTGAAVAATYDPATLNAMIHGCAAGSMTVRLNIDATESGKTKDTVKLTGPILIGGRLGKTTTLTMDRPATVPTGVLDTLFTFTENSAVNPSMLVDSVNNTLHLLRMAFARKVVNQDTSTISILADSSLVSGCQFWTAETKLGALLNVGANAVLVERSLFRAPLNLNGYARAIRWAGNFSKLEARANVFFGTGLSLSANGSFHVIANTFAGSRNQYNPIIIGNALGTSFNNAVIMHNLFALKADTLPPIVFSTPASAVTTDSILRNAWTQGKAGLALAVTEPPTTGITIRGATGQNVNVALPRGFSNYGPNAGDVKDYPLTELRTDSTLARKHPDFGKVYRVFFTGNWAGSPTPMADISTYAPKMYFPGFSPFMAGKTWLANAKVGAFVDQDTITVPSPLAAGVQGASLKVQPDSTASDKAKITQITFDQDYYKQLLLPEYAYFFFSNSLSKLTSSNDTSALLATAGVKGYRQQWTGFDNMLSVPKEVRNGPSVDIFVKMLHFRGSFMAAVQSNAAIATLSNFPGFPANDLALSVVRINNLSKSVDLKVTRNTEQIDSIRILTLNESGQQVASVDIPVPSGSTSFTPTVTVTDKGRYFFQAVPVANIGGGVFKAGSPTASQGPVDIGLSTSDSVYVTTTATCPGADGTSAKPYCLLDSALKVIGSKGGGTIIVTNGSLPMTDITIDSIVTPGASNLTITTAIVSGVFDENRPVFLGDKKEALTITRKNVTLRGFTLEQPAAGTKAALAVNAGGCLIDGNIFRAHTKGSVEAPAITVSVGSSADARIINNVIWGFAKGVQLSSTSSSNVKILFNTFFADSTLNKTPTSGILTTGSDSVGAVVADNFFSGLTDPIDVSLALKHPVLDRNVYTAGVNLHNLSESGGLGPSTPILYTDIWVAKYVQEIKNALTGAVECSSIAPCNPLYGGSSANDYGVTVTTDVLGKPRKNRKEVGALEYPSAPSAVMGVLEIHPTLIQGNFRQIKYTVSGKSFDPDPEESDSVQVFWLNSDVTKTIDGTLTPVPANQHKKYPISKLVSGDITDSADGILEFKKYWFYAALSRYRSSRAMGFAYSDTVTSGHNLLYTDCHFNDSKSACPSETGIFGVDTGTWTGKFETRVLLSQPTDTGVVKLPRFITATNTNQYGLDLTSPLPVIYLDVSIKSLDTSKGKQKLSWQVQTYFNPELTGLDLFLLPADPNGKPALVPDWTLVPVGGGKYSINFESTIDGPQVYAFGKLQVAPGTAAQSDDQPPIYDFAQARRDSTAYRVPFKFKGAGFKTSNPLVLISAIPSGGTIYPLTGSRVPKVMSKDYPLKTIVASAGYSGLDDTLRVRRMYELYLKAVVAEAAEGAGGPKKPFVFDSVSQPDFADAIQLLPDDLDLSGGETTVQMQFPKLFNDYSHYPDQVGKATRSLELVMTVFDGDRISRTRGFIRMRFYDSDLHNSEYYNRKSGFPPSSHDKPHWNLFGYPWAEADSGTLARIFAKGKWDSDNMRLLAYQGTGEGMNAFTAYDGTNASAIPFDSGMAVWSGSTGNYLPAVASGTSLDYQPFKMSLTSGRYYDISVPFNFPMRWQDILDSSGIPAANAPAMWRFNDSAVKWVAVQAASASPPTPGAVLFPWEGYTIKVATAQTLTFPLADTTRTASAVAKVAANDGSWAVNVEARDATGAMDLRIGRGAREMLFPEPPDVPGQDFRVSLVKGEEKVSQFIQSQDGGWEGNWSLRGVAAKGAGGISLRIGDATREVPVWLADATHATAVPLSKTQPVTLSESDLKANDYHLVAGDKDYLERTLQSLVSGHILALSNYPNPFSGATLIRYALPAGFGRTSFDLKVRDFRGRTVWEKTIEAGNSLSYLWDGHDRSGLPLPAGIYNLSLTAKPEGKPAYRAQRNLLRM